MHGFNNGGSFLSSCIFNYNIACVQEYWLHECVLTKLRDCFPDYGCIYISSMSLEDISRLGRPYGGLVVYYSLSNEFKVQLLRSSYGKRVLSIKSNYNGHNFTIFNVYFPCSSVSIEYFDQIALICGFIYIVLYKIIVIASDCDIIISDDFNYYAESVINNDALLMLFDIFNSYDLKLCDE